MASPWSDRLAALNLSIAHVDRLGEIPMALWDRHLGADHFYQSHAWLSAVEGEVAAKRSYIVVMSGPDLVGALSLYRSAFEPNPYYAESRYAEVFRTEGPFAMAGSLRGYRNDLPLDPRLRPETRAEVVNLMVEAAQAKARSWGCRNVVFPYLTPMGVRTLAAAHGAVLAFDNAEAVIEVGGDGLASYLDRLPTDRRKMVRREMRRFDETGLVIGREDLEQSLPVAAMLLTNLERKYGREASPQGVERMLRHQSRHLRDRALMLTCREPDGAAVGFALRYQWHDCLYGRMVGFDYPRLRSAFELFNLAYYRTIACMGEGGLTRLHLGMGTLQAKVLRGATVHPLWAALPDGIEGRISSGDRRRRDHEAADRILEGVPRSDAVLPAAEWSELI